MLQCSKTFVPFCFPYIQLCFGVFACCSVAKSTVFFPRNWASLGQCLINNLVGFITQTWQPSKQTRFVEGEQEFQRGTESTATPAADRLLRDIAEYIAEVNTRRQHEQQGKQNFKKLCIMQYETV